jgi:pimeloyl-ACP methyl ester carboxylesterase
MKIFQWLVSGLAFVLLILAVAPLLVPIPPLKDTLPPAQLADPDSHFIKVNGLTVHYKIEGRGEPVMILLHGFGASVFSWREVMGPLAEQGTVIAYDRPAFGLTERPMPGEWQGHSPYSLEAQADLLTGLMDALGVKQAVLVGNSAGGTVSVYAALKYPQRVKALVLVDAAIYSTGSGPSWLRGLYNTRQIDHIGPLIARSLESRGDDLIRMAWHDPTQVTQDILDGYHKPLRADNWDRALWELTKAPTVPDLAYRLGELKLPVLVMTGDDDRIVPTDQSHRLANEIPRAELSVVPACGHLPQEEQPGLFMGAVVGFLSGMR